MLDLTQRSSADYQSWSSEPDTGSGRRHIKDDGDDNSGVCSPPLWKTSPQHQQNSYASKPQSSRAEAIARGQKELMEMVSKMPEGCYELSLKDIVEQTMVDEVVDGVKEESFGSKRIEDNTQIKKKKVHVNRSGSLDNSGDFLIKMVLPVAWNPRNKRSNSKRVNKSDSSLGSTSGRVSPRPLLYDAKGGENEWWKNRYVESENGGFSSNSGSSKSSCSSGSSRNSSVRRGGGNCWCFIFCKREKNTE